MIKKALLLLSCVVTLSACVPAALVVGATAGGAILYDKRGFKTMSNDNHAMMQATHAIRKAKLTPDKSDVTVTVYNGIGLIVGEVDSTKTKLKIGKVVAKTSHVRRVYNEVLIAGDGSTLSDVNDAWLAGKVKTHLLLKSGLKSGDIKIVVQSGRVYLMGVVSKYQASLAVEAARQISGVKKVVKVFEYR